MNSIIRDRCFLILFSILLLICAAPCAAGEFRIGEFRALSLLGEARLLPEADYVSFTGDFGFSGALPDQDAIDRHVRQEFTFFANFKLRVINLESKLAGSSGRELDRRIDEVTLDVLKKTGFDLVARANNHAVDFGPEGVGYNTRRLQESGYAMIGIRPFFVYQKELGGSRVAIFALTEYTDRPDPERVVFTIDRDLDLIREESSKADFRIAFVHLGSMSFYPSPHERRQVTRLVEAGVDLVVCTGSHFIKGFVHERGKPVFYGLGNHLFSSVTSDTEPSGMHVVAGFSKGKLVQLFVVPFLNTIMKGKSGPLSEAAFTDFGKTLLDRSTSDSNRYFADPTSLAMLKERVRRVKVCRLLEIRARHLVYAFGILYNHYSLIIIGGCLLLLTLAGLFARRLVLRRIGARD